MPLDTLTSASPESSNGTMEPSSSPVAAATPYDQSTQSTTPSSEPAPESSEPVWTETEPGVWRMVEVLGQVAWNLCHVRFSCNGQIRTTFAKAADILTDADVQRLILDTEDQSERTRKKVLSMLADSLWQPLANIAKELGLHPRGAFNILCEMAASGDVEMDHSSSKGHPWIIRLSQDRAIAMAKAPKPKVVWINKDPFKAKWNWSKMAIGDEIHMTSPNHQANRATALKAARKLGIVLRVRRNRDGQGSFVKRVE